MFYGPREAMHPVRLSHLFSKLGTVTSLGLAGTIMVSSPIRLCASMTPRSCRRNGGHGKLVHWPLHCSVRYPLRHSRSCSRQLQLSFKFQLRWVLPVRYGVVICLELGVDGKRSGRVERVFSLVWFSHLSTGQLAEQIYNDNAESRRFSTICLIFRKNWGYLFNNDPEVIAIVADIMPYIALFQVSWGEVYRCSKLTPARWPTELPRRPDLSFDLSVCTPPAP